MIVEDLIVDSLCEVKIDIALDQGSVVCLADARFVVVIKDQGFSPEYLFLDEITGDQRVCQEAFRNILVLVIVGFGLEAHNRVF